MAQPQAGRAETRHPECRLRHGQPRTITLDGFEPSHSALRRMGMRNEFNFRGLDPVKIGSCQYLNNIAARERTQPSEAA